MRTDHTDYPRAWDLASCTDGLPCTSCCRLYFTEHQPLALHSTPQSSHWLLLARLALLLMTNPMSVTDRLVSCTPWAQHSPSGWGCMSSLAQSLEQAHGWHPGEAVKRATHCQPANPLLPGVWRGSPWLTCHPATSLSCPLFVGAGGVGGPLGFRLGPATSLPPHMPHTPHFIPLSWLFTLVPRCLGA